MEQLLVGLFGISLSCGALIVVLLVLAGVLRQRYVARLRVVLWLLVGLRLLVPFTLSLPAAGAVNIVVPRSFARPATGAPVLPNAVLPGTPAGGAIAGTAAGGIALSPLQILAALWLAGIALLLVYHVVATLWFRRRVRRFSAEASPQSFMVLHSIARQMGLKRPPALRVCPIVASPLLTGLFRPTLLLPQTEVPAEELRLILHHELVHYARRDVWVKFVLLAAATLHWYNPLVWVMLHRAGADMELACDEAVVQGLGREGRAAYGQVVLRGIAGHRSAHAPLSTQFASSRKTAKARLLGLFDARHKKRGAAVCTSFVLVAALATSLVACTAPASSSGVQPAPGAQSAGTSSQGAPAPVSPSSTAPAHAVVPVEPAMANMETVESDGKIWYLVENEIQLQSINYNEETLSRNYIQNGHITLTGEWRPIGSEEYPFTGIYAGNGYHVAGLSVTSPAATVAALFGYVQNGTVYNVTVLKPDIARSGATNVAPVVATALGESGRVYDNTVLTGEKPAGLTGEAVVWESSTLRWYEDGAPYIKDNFTNHTSKAITGYTYAMLPYNAEGTPLQIHWGFGQSDDTPAYSNMTEVYPGRGPDSEYYVPPGGIFDVRGGWSIFSEVDENGNCPVAYVLLCFETITFEDGTVWQNPGFDDWLHTYRGNPVPVEELAGYYPHAQSIS